MVGFKASKEHNEPKVKLERPLTDVINGIYYTVGATALKAAKHDSMVGHFLQDVSRGNYHILEELIHPKNKEDRLGQFSAAMAECLAEEWMTNLANKIACTVFNSTHEMDAFLESLFGFHRDAFHGEAGDFLRDNPAIMIARIIEITGMQ